MSRRARCQAAAWLIAFAACVVVVICVSTDRAAPPAGAPPAAVALPAPAVLPATPVAAAPASPASKALPAKQRWLGGAPKDRSTLARAILLHDAPVRGASFEDSAVTTLERHAAELAPIEWVRTLSHRDTRSIPSGTVVRFQQESEGVPVYNGGAIVLVGPNGGARYATVQALPGLPEGVSATPSVGPEAARTAAETDFDTEEGIASGNPGLFVVQDGPSPTLAWVVPVTTAVPFGSYLVQVDANSADVLETRDILLSATGHGRVFNPNPVTSSGNLGLRDDFDHTNGDLSGALTDMDLNDLDGSGFLRGPLLDVITGDGTDRVLSPPLEFSFQRDNPGFEQTMCYAYLQLALEYAATVGHPNPLERQLRVHARFSEGDDEVLNAFFEPASGFLFFGTKGVDLAEDGTVILHELGHALQDAAASTDLQKFGNSHEGGSMGEGFGDFWAVSVLSDRLIHEPTTLGHWVSYGDLDYPFGNAFFAGVHRSVDTQKVWPRDADPSRDIHLDGEIWSAALWEIRTLLGRDAANRLVLDSHYLLLPDARFQDGSLALIAANQTLFAGAHEDEIKAILQGRGVYDPAGTVGDDFLEDNDSPLEASDVLEGGTGVHIDDLVSRDEDWFWLPVPVGDVLDLGIQFVNQNGDLDLGLAVLDPTSFELEVVTTSETQQDIEEIVADTRGVLQAFADEDGLVNFFALVLGSQGATNDYSLEAQVANPGTGQTVTELAIGDSFDANMQTGDVDVVAFDGLKDMVLSIQTKKKGSTGAQVEVELWNENGMISTFGSGLGARGVKEAITLPETGGYALFLRGAGGSTGAYSLKLKGKAPKVKANETVTFANDQEFAVFDVEALAGTHVIVKAKAKGKNEDGTKLQPVIYLFDGEGNLLSTNSSGGKPSAAMDFAVPDTGIYYGAIGPADDSHGTAKVTGKLKLPKSKRVLREVFE